MEEQYPPFTERFTPSYQAAPPMYEEVLLIGVLAITLLSGILFAVTKKREYQLLAAPFTERASELEFLPHPTSGLIGRTTLQGAIALFYAATLLTLTTIHESTSSLIFWTEAAKAMAKVLALFAVSFLTNIWIWSTFGKQKVWQRWAWSYFLLSVAFGLSLLFPLLLTLISDISRNVLWSGVLLFFLLYRLLSFRQVLRYFPLLRTSLLHIILYLCTCEIGPLYLLYRWSNQ